MRAAAISCAACAIRAHASPMMVIGERAARRLEVAWHWRPYISVEQNLALSQARAGAVQAVLTQAGLTGELFTASGALDESSFFTRARRVELKVVSEAAANSTAVRDPPVPDK